MLYIFFDLNFFSAKPRFLRYPSELPFIWTFLFFKHGLYYNLTNVTKIKIQFKTITWTLCGLFFCPEMSQSLVHIPNVKKRTPTSTHTKSMSVLSPFISMLFMVKRMRLFKYMERNILWLLLTKGICLKNP